MCAAPRGTTGHAGLRHSGRGDPNAGRGRAACAGPATAERTRARGQALAQSDDGHGRIRTPARCRLSPGPTRRRQLRRAPPSTRREWVRARLAADPRGRDRLELRQRRGRSRSRRSVRPGRRAASRAAVRFGLPPRRPGRPADADRRVVRPTRPRHRSGPGRGDHRRTVRVHRRGHHRAGPGRPAAAGVADVHQCARGHPPSRTTAGRLSASGRRLATLRARPDPRPDGGTGALPDPGAPESHRTLDGGGDPAGARR